MYEQEVQYYDETECPNCTHTGNGFVKAAAVYTIVKRQRMRFGTQQQFFLYPTNPPTSAEKKVLFYISLWWTSSAGLCCQI